MHRMSFHEYISRSPDSGSVHFAPSQKTSMAFCKTLPFTVTASFRTLTGFPINSVKETYICKKYYSVFSFIVLKYTFSRFKMSIQKTDKYSHGFCAIRISESGNVFSLDIPAQLFRVYCSKSPKCNILYSIIYPPVVHMQ